MPTNTLALALAAIILTVRATLAVEAPPPEPDGYRLDAYHAPTPLTVAGVAAIDTGEARRLWEARGAAFIDVVAAPRRPDALPTGAVWVPKPRLDIPGSVWLPDSGEGALGPALEAWFRANLERITVGDRAAPLVFYCRADCWMSWNATKRALAWGYSGARWYRDGTDGWSEAALPLAEAQPPSDAPR